MKFPDVSLMPGPRNPCPVCGAETALAEIEAHPLHANFEIHGYLCDRCGPIKSIVVRIGPENLGKWPRTRPGSVAAARVRSSFSATSIRHGGRGE
jgi:hypothetical protein